MDVSREYLDGANSDGASLRLSNDEAERQQLVARSSAAAPTLVVMEAAGRLERALAAQLSAARTALRIINARYVRHFAKATGLLAKTDRLDAGALVRFAQTPARQPAIDLTTDLATARREARESNPPQGPEPERPPPRLVLPGDDRSL